MKYGLVLSGGGGKGGYHVGVWKALRELNINITAVTGTSVGALIGAMVAQDAYDEAYELWSNMHYSTVLNVDKGLYTCLVELNKSIRLDTFNKLLKKGDQIREQGGLDVSPLKNLIDNLIDEDTLRNSDIDYGLVTVSLSDMKSLELFTEDIPKGQLGDYLLASSHLPGFAPMELDGKRYIDGGFHDNLPINLILKKDIDKIIAVDMGAIGRKRGHKKTDKEIILIEPSGKIAALMEFDAAQSRKDIHMGYLDTLKAFNQVSGLAYYLDDLPNETAIIEFLQNMPEAYVNKIFETMKISAPIKRRMVFEQLVPHIAKLFGCDQTASYSDLLVTITEYMANQYDIKRLHRYDYNDFLYIVLKHIKENPTIPESEHTIYSIDKIMELFGFSASKHLVAKLLLGAYHSMYEIMPPNLLNKHYTVKARKKNESISEIS